MPKAAPLSLEGLRRRKAGPLRGTRPTHWFWALGFAVWDLGFGIWDLGFYKGGGTHCGGAGARGAASIAFSSP
jgi:hypothetical protein